MSTDEEREKRRAARASWPGWFGRLEDAPDAEDLRPYTTIEQRIALVGELSARGWALSGKPVPDYARSQAPGRVVRSDEQ